MLRPQIGGETGMRRTTLADVPVGQYGPGRHAEIVAPCRVHTSGANGSNDLRDGG